MRPAPAEWDDLRLAAKAADRCEAAEELRPAFERRLRQLGYGPRAIAHAFSALAGPDAVDDVLCELAHNARVERSRAVTLDFEVSENAPALPPGHALTITGVERDGHGIRIRYAIRPPLPAYARGPRGQARDDWEREYTSPRRLFRSRET